MTDLSIFGGWLPLVIVALLCALYVLWRWVENALARWLVRKDMDAWRRENGYDDWDNWSDGDL